LQPGTQTSWSALYEFGDAGGRRFGPWRPRLPRPQSEVSEQATAHEKEVSDLRSTHQRALDELRTSAAQELAELRELRATPAEDPGALKKIWFHRRLSLTSYLIEAID
jgi:hypothetical protein